MFSIEWYFPWQYLDWVLRAQLLLWLVSIAIGFWVMRLGMQGRWLKGGDKSTTKSSRVVESSVQDDVA